MKKGFTFIEVILAISLISMVAIYFIPSITFGYINLLNSGKYTEESFKVQEEIEREMESIRKGDSIGGDKMEIFGVEILGHKINKKTGNSSEINVFQPKLNEDLVYKTPKLLKDGHDKATVVLLDEYDKDTFKKAQPKSTQMFISDLLNKNLKLLADERKFKIDDKSIHLVNVYKWYTSPMTKESNDYKANNFSILKEWNAARPELEYENSMGLSLIPNIKDTPSYNSFQFTEVLDGLGLDQTNLINQFGNRYIYYSVTPYAVSGKIGKEEISNGIYINAPRIEIEKAVFGPKENQISIHFKESIKEIVNFNSFHLNEIFTKQFGAERNLEDYKILVLEFEQPLNQNATIKGNNLGRGAVESIRFGAIDIWSNGEPNGEFEIIKDN